VTDPRQHDCVVWIDWWPGNGGRYYIPSDVWREASGAERNSLTWIKLNAIMHRPSTMPGLKVVEAPPDPPKKGKPMPQAVAALFYLLAVLGGIVLGVAFTTLAHAQTLQSAPVLGQEYAGPVLCLTVTAAIDINNAYEDSIADGNHVLNLYRSTDECRKGSFRPGTISEIVPRTWLHADGEIGYVLGISFPGYTRLFYAPATAQPAEA